MVIFTRYKFLFLVCGFLAPFLASAHIGANGTQQKSALLFIENKGQVTDQNHHSRNDILFKLDGGAVTIFVGNGTMHYQWSKGLGNATDNSNTPAKNTRFNIYRLDVELLNANKHAEVTSEDKQDYFEQYYNEHLPNGATALSYKKITFKNIYPNIDWVLYVNTSATNENALKYDFVVHPGGDYKNIQIRYKGATTVALKEGALIASTPFGNIAENAPYTYNAQTKEKINSSFILKDNILSYNITSATDSKEDIIIDPFLAWSTYYGGPQNEYGLGVTTDLTGNAYLAGQTVSPSNIATIGAYQTTISGAEDGFIVKFNLMGQRQWATYYGGSNQDYFNAIAFDGAGSLYAAGLTYSSSGISSPVSHQDVFGGIEDAFLVKFNLNGQRQWATYYGGSQTEIGNDVTCDKNGDIYLVGRTNSINNMTTPGSYRDTYIQYNMAYGTNGFIAKFNSAGTRQWATYHQCDYITGVACDTFNNVYVVGSASIDTAIATPGCHQPNKNSTGDGFLAKFNSYGIKQWGTYYGGASSDETQVVTCDLAGNAYIGGFTYSNNAIATTNSFISNTNTTDAFVVKFSPLGVRTWGTYMGGATDDNVFGLAVSRSGIVYVSGVTNSPTNIASSPGVHQSTYGGGPNDVYLMTLDKSGYKQYGTYLGGSGNDLCNDLTLSNIAGLYLSATTSSTNGIAQPSTIYQYTHAGNNDAVLALFVTDTLFYANQPFNDTLFCQGDSLYLKYTVIPNMPVGTTYTAWLSDSAGSFASPIAIGSYTAQGSGAVPSKIPLNVPPGKNYRVRVSSSSIPYPTADTTLYLRIKETPVKPVLSANTPFCEPDSLKLKSTTTTTTAGLIYKWTGAGGFVNSNMQNFSIANAKANIAGLYTLELELDGCKSQDTITVNIKPMPVKPEIVHNAPVCEGDTLMFKIVGDTVNVIYTWAWPNPEAIPQFNNIYDKATRAFSGLYTVVANKNGCIQKDTATIIVKPRPVITASSGPAIAEEDLQLFTNTVDTINTLYKWTGPNGFNSSERNPVIKGVTMQASGTYTVNASIDGCNASAITIILVRQSTADKYFTLYPNPNKGSFTIKGYTDAAQYIEIDVVDATGKQVFKDSFTTLAKAVNHNVTLPIGLASGVYMLRIHADKKNTALRFLVGQ